MIEPGIPIPAAKTARVSHDSVYAAMGIGDSFACAEGAAKRLIQSAHRFGKQHQRKFTLRKIDAETSRIWRTE